VILLATSFFTACWSNARNAGPPPSLTTPGRTRNGVGTRGIGFRGLQDWQDQVGTFGCCARAASGHADEQRG
jgi:hypothetical protein